MSEQQANVVETLVMMQAKARTPQEVYAIGEAIKALSPPQPSGEGPYRVVYSSNEPWSLVTGPTITWFSEGRTDHQLQAVAWCDRLNAAFHAGRASRDAGGVGEVSFTALRDANATRATRWDNGSKPPLSFALTELAGEVGEACNEGKKLARHEMGMVGGITDTSGLARELGDVVICADLVAWRAGIDLGAAVAAKFNATSEKHGFPERLSAAKIAGGAPNG